MADLRNFTEKQKAQYNAQKSVQAHKYQQQANATQSFGNGLLDLGMTVNGFMPITGDIQSGLLAANDIKQGNYGSAALNGLGVLPFIPSMAGIIHGAGKNADDIAKISKSMYREPILSALPIPKTKYELAHEAARIDAFKNHGLPENNTYIDRAKAMGYEDDLFHGTRKQFERFDLNKTGTSTDDGWFGKAAYTSRNPEYASEYAQYDLMPTIPVKTDEGIVMPLKAKLNSYETSNAGLTEEIINKIKKNGYDSIDNGDEVAIFNPANIRSRFAAFNMSNANSHDILGNVTPEMLGLLAVGSGAGVGYAYSKKDKK